ncbi:YggT family protein [Leeia sp. TBRC 13508]|uniref:YggT family protein n=1 Tax=Leeia speluncae TaxID=2884804 RepID=A0ABS8D4U6_9NEIS|nr:YggT family protein [Leeia speluncae]MCB6182996.1 YggT family protein [Leeia speluncae]
MANAINFILDAIGGFFLLTLLTRFILQVVRAPFSNPLAQFTIKFTNWAVIPARKIIPGIKGYDIATLLLVFLGSWLLKALELFIALTLHGGLGWLSPQIIPVSFLAGLVFSLQLLLYLWIGSTFMIAILSWTQPGHPLSSVLYAIVRPLLAPIQRIIPPVSGFDLAPLVLILILQVVLYFVIPSLEVSLHQLLLPGVW